MTWKFVTWSLKLYSWVTSHDSDYSFYYYNVTTCYLIVLLNFQLSFILHINYDHCHLSSFSFIIFYTFYILFTIYLEFCLIHFYIKFNILNLILSTSSKCVESYFQGLKPHIYVGVILIILTKNIWRLIFCYTYEITIFCLIIN